MRFLIGKGLMSRKSSISSTAKGKSFNEKNHDSGSKDESFFESRSRLDSDHEEDFFSTHGESTPSTGSTPNNQPTALKAIPNTQSGQSPPSDSIKKLSELLREKSELPRSSNVGPSLSKTHSSSSDEVSPEEDLKDRKARYQKSKQCCMPRFGSSLSSKERRRKKKASTVE